MMSRTKIVLIACCGKKANEAKPARLLYQSALFTKSLAYAETLTPDYIFILSAKLGLVEIDEKIEPYDLSMGQLSEFQRSKQRRLFVEQLREKIPDGPIDVIVLAGSLYIKGLYRNLASYYQDFSITDPLDKMPIGRRLQFLANKK